MKDTLKKTENTALRKDSSIQDEKYSDAFEHLDGLLKDCVPSTDDINESSLKNERLKEI